MEIVGGWGGGGGGVGGGGWGFFFNDTATTEIYTLSLHDALPISTNFNDGSWDVIVSAEVIEHLENPRATVREWARLLKPGGLLVFSTPNNESLRSIMSLIFRGHYADFSDSSYPAHITPLLRKDIERIMQEARCGSTKVYFTNNGRDRKSVV